MGRNETRIRQILEHQGRSQTWLARRLGISQPYVAMLVGGQRQWTNKLRKGAAMVLDMPVAMLFDIVESTLEVVDSALSEGHNGQREN